MTLVSRLARGYVRQELRHTKKTDGLKVGYDFFLSHKSLLENYLLRNKRLPENAPQQILDNMINNFLPQLMTVGSLPKDLEFKGLRAKTCKQVNALYWEAHEHALTNSVNQRGFDDETVDLRFTRLCVDRKRIILDDIAVPVSVSEHALGRMSERGYSVETPLATLSGEMDKWLPLSMAYLFAGIHLKKVFGIGIPLGDGFMLGNVVGQQIRPSKPNDPAGDWMLARRAQADNRGFNVFQPPRQDFFRIDQTHTILLRITTFISGKQLKWEQEWLRDRLLLIMDRHQDILPSITEMIIEGRILDEESTVGVNALLVDLVRLIEDDVWQDTIRVGN